MSLQRLLFCALLLSIVFVSGGEAKTPEISNECGVECFPCIDPDDTHCRQPGLPWPGDIPFICMNCVRDNDRVDCEVVAEGNTVCGVVTDGNNITSCTTSGSFCSAITVNP